MLKMDGWMMLRIKGMMNGWLFRVDEGIADAQYGWLNS